MFVAVVPVVIVLGNRDPPAFEDCVADELENKDLLRLVPLPASSLGRAIEGSPLGLVPVLEHVPVVLVVTVVVVLAPPPITMGTFFKLRPRRYWCWE